MYLFICTRHREFGISTFCAFCDYLTRCKVRDFGKKMIFFYEIFQVGACPNLKDSSFYDRFIIHMYKARSIRFLWLFCAICDSLMSCTIHFFWKKVIFHEIFQVGVCLNLKDSSFYDWFSIHVYKAWSNRYLLIFCSICDSLMLYKVHFVWKRWFFMKYFKLVHAPTWKIPHYMKVILFICTRQEAFCIFKFFSLSRTLLCLVRYIFGEKDDFFFIKYFKLVHAPTWKIPHYMTGFLSICTRHEAFGLFPCFALSATLLCLVWYIFLEKYDFFNEIFQVGACPN